MKKPGKRQDTYSFDRAVWRIGHLLLRPFCRLRYNFTSQELRPQHHPCLIMANHLMACDPVLLGSVFAEHMYFVASEHVLRHSGSQIFVRLTHPLLRVKGRTESGCAMDILRQLRTGHNVCIFIEGERSWDGLTLAIPESAAHLAKLSGSALLTYRLHGGYLAHPRWSTQVRRGKVWGEAVREYAPEELKAMSRPEVLAAIQRDLDLDSLAEQEQLRLPYRCSRPAEHLETALFICPACGAMDILRSQGDLFSCSCGLWVRYDRYGFFHSAEEGGQPPFATVRDWFAWQRERIGRIVASGDYPADRPLAGDDQQSVYLMEETGPRLLGQGRLELWPDRLEFRAQQGESFRYPVAELEDIACEEQMLLSFIHHDVIHEVRSGRLRPAVKYQLIFRALKQAAATTKQEDI